jgi:hypothetical protein
LSQRGITVRDIVVVINDKEDRAEGRRRRKIFPCEKEHKLPASVVEKSRRQLTVAGSLILSALTAAEVRRKAIRPGG